MRMLAAALVAAFPTTLLHAQEPTPNDSSPEVRALRERLDELERRLNQPGAGAIDLSDREVAASSVAADGTTLGRAWYENFDVWGFGALRYIDTGSAGEDRHGGFKVPQAALYIEAHAFEDTSVYVDLQLVPFAHDGDKVTRTGEIYLHQRNLWRNESGDSMGLKAGRIYIPFGEEYTRFRAPDNPLISVSAPFPYGFDEGVELYGTNDNLSWIAALTDGSDERSERDGVAKSFNGKLSGYVCESLYLSGSLMWNGEHAESAMELSGSHFEPVGAGGSSSAGTSPSEEVSASLYQGDARWQIQDDVELGLALGHARIHDDAPGFDRSLTWFSIEPRFQITPRTFATLRLSEIGTYDDQEGYHIDGEPLAAGNDAFGYDAQRMQRLSVGIAHEPNPKTVLKFEVGRDRYWLIDGASAASTEDSRDFIGIELVVSF